MQVNDNKENQKEVEQLIFEKGITLVALVVTIIVLLILAGITINMATSGSGIFARAKNAANVYRQAVRDENTALDSYANEINKVIEENGGGYETKISEETSYVGFYADVENDGTVDGVIYADMAKGNTKSGKWNNDDFSSYTIPKKTNLKDYFISQNSYTGSFGTKAVISPVENTSGDDRFYIMALKDIDGRQDGTFYDWYYAAGISNYSKVTSENFGSGKSNTTNMIEHWNSGTKKNADTKIKEGADDFKDIWGQIQNKASNGWFVPSKDELAAFAGEIEVTKDTTNSQKYFKNQGLSEYYWTSSLQSTNKAYFINFSSGSFSRISIQGPYHVRLSKTF